MYADAFYSLLLGWMKSIADWFWAMINNDGQRGLWPWFADHWLGVFIALLIIGILLDWLIWMLRWRPYKIWMSHLRTLFGHNRITETLPEENSELPSDPNDGYFEDELDVYDPVSMEEFQTDPPTPMDAYPETNDTLWTRPALADANTVEILTESTQEVDDTNIWTKEDGVEASPEEIDELEKADTHVEFAHELSPRLPLPNTKAAYGRPGRWPGETWPIAEAPVDTLPDTDMSLDTDTPRRRRSARWQQVAQPKPVAEPETWDEEEDAEIPTVVTPMRTVQRRTESEDGVLRTVTGMRAQRRGLLRLGSNEDEAIAGLPPLMTPEEAYRRPIYPEEEDVK